MPIPPSPSDSEIRSALRALCGRLTENTVMELAEGRLDDNPGLKAEAEELLRTDPSAHAFYEEYRKGLAVWSDEESRAAMSRIFAKAGTAACVESAPLPGTARKADTSAPLPVIKNRRVASGVLTQSGWAIGQQRDLEGGLDWEERVEAKVIHIISPFVTAERYPACAPRIESILRQKFLKCTFYTWAMPNKYEAKKLSSWLSHAFAENEPKLRWSDFGAEGQNWLNTQMQERNFDQEMQQSCKECPVWILCSFFAVRKEVTDLQAREAYTGSSAYKAYWIAELRDETQEAFEFAGQADILGADPKAASLVGMHPKNIALIHDRLVRKGAFNLEELPVWPPTLFDQRYDAWKARLERDTIPKTREQATVASNVKSL